MIDASEAIKKATAFMKNYVDSFDERNNVKKYGALGDAKTDDTQAFLDALKENEMIYLPDGNYIIDYRTCRDNSIHEHCYGEGVLHYTNYDWGGTVTTYGGGYHGRECRFGGIYDTELYKSMHRLNESPAAYAIETNSKDLRAPYVSTVHTFTGDRDRLNNMGSVRLRYGYECPDSFTLCFGKGKIWGLKKNRWHLLIDGPVGGALYKEGWADNTAVNVTPVDYRTHREIPLTKELWYSGDCMRLWHTYTASYVLDSDEVNTDYTYFICSQEVWIKEKEYEDYFTFGCSSDMRCADSTLPKADYIHEFGQGRSLILKSYPRTCYWHNIPNGILEQISLPISANETYFFDKTAIENVPATTFTYSVADERYRFTFPPIRETLTDDTMKYCKLIEFSNLKSVNCQVFLMVESDTLLKPIEYHVKINITDKTAKIVCLDETQTNKYISCTMDTNNGTCAIYLRADKNITWKIGEVVVDINQYFGPNGHVLVSYDKELTVTNPQFLYHTEHYNKYWKTLDGIVCSNGDGLVSFDTTTEDTTDESTTTDESAS